MVIRESIEEASVPDVVSYIAIRDNKSACKSLHEYSDGHENLNPPKSPAFRIGKID